MAAHDILHDNQEAAHKLFQKEDTELGLDLTDPPTVIDRNESAFSIETTTPTEFAIEAPTRVGQEIVISHGEASGSMTIVSEEGYDITADNDGTITLSAGIETVILIGLKVEGVIQWRVKNALGELIHKADKISRCHASASQ